MTSIETEFASEGFQGKHIFAAGFSILLSVLIHGSLLYWFSTSKYTDVLMPKRPAKTEEAHPTFRLMEVIKHEAPEILGKDAVVRKDMIRVGKGQAVAQSKRETGGMELSLDKAVIEPPALTEKPIAGEAEAVAEPGVIPPRLSWEPRQDIMMIDSEEAVTEIPGLERRKIPKIERTIKASDITAPIDRETMVAELRGEKGIDSGVLGKSGRDQGGIVEGGVAGGGGKALDIAKLESGINDVLFAEKARKVTDLRPIEKLLKADISVYTGLFDRKYGYFKIEINRLSPEVLPVIPKDFLFIQDCSASMAEQRLYFCRTGMVNCLPLIGKGDRFNVVGFKDKAIKCFPDWAENKPEALEKAKSFIEEMKSTGNTDIYASLKDIMDIKKTQGRPVIVFLITDGRPTAGLTDSSDIIGEFSKINNGVISVFAMGTIQVANKYLLDLLSFCNRGDSYVVDSGRWGIPESIDAFMRRINSPLLTDVGFLFADLDRVEVYPVMLSNLYLDGPMVLYGRYPREMPRVVFQALGQTMDVKCDMIFDISLKDAQHGDGSIKENWAKHKIYYYIGEYTKTREAEMLKGLKETARAYGLKVPYSGEFKAKQ